MASTDSEQVAGFVETRFACFNALLSMKRVLWWVAAVIAVWGGVPLVARAEDPTDPSAKDRAATEFDSGKTAYEGGHWNVAASYFEAADEALPSVRALRMAIRSHDKAGHAARATTLAGVALVRYAKDAGTRELADEVIAKYESALHRVEVRCTAPCTIAVGDQPVSKAPAERWIVFVDAGEVELSASFATGVGERQVLTAQPGGKNSIHFVAPAGVVVDEPTADPRPEPNGDAMPPARTPERANRRVDEDDANHGTSAAESSSTWIEHPGVFVGLLVATAAVGGVTIWSGVDTIKSPGKDGVREACAGLGTDCPEYREGRQKQLRTNILIGTTAGMGALTAIFAIFVTDWGGTGATTPTAFVSVDQARLGVEGRF